MMTTLLTVRGAAHIAVWNATERYGGMMLPRPCDDLPDPSGGPEGLHAADFAGIMTTLSGVGASLAEDEDGFPLVEPMIDTAGLEIVALTGHLPEGQTDFDPARFAEVRQAVLATVIAAAQTM